MAFFNHSLRKLSPRQLSDGTSANLLDLDALLNSAISRFNNLLRGDIGPRYTRQLFHLGWEPPKLDTGAAREDQDGTKLPYCRVHNTQDNTLRGTTAPDDYNTNGQNPWRHKGIETAPINPTTETDQLTDQYSWTTALSFSGPTILDSVRLMLTNDDIEYRNFFLNFGTAGTLKTSATQIIDGYTAYNFISDLGLNVMVDSPLDQNRCELASLAANKFSFRADSANMVPGTVSVTDFLPNTIISTFPQGIMVEMKDLNLSLPAFSRVRISVLLPWYDPDAWNTPWNAGVTEPWQKNPVDLTVCVLEEVR